MSYPRYPAYKASGVAWLGEIPAHWEVKPLKALLRRNDSGVWGDDFDDEGTVVLRSTEQTVDGRWQLDNPARRKLSASEALSTRLEVGDLVVTKSSGSELHIGKTTLVDSEIAALQASFSNFMQRLRLSDEHLPRYVWYYMNCPVCREQLVFLSSTTTGLGNLNGKILGSVLIPKATIPEQQAIAAFLDRKTAELDALIAEKQRLLALLQEQRAALITQAVTKGLDPSAPRKQSGVAWLGEIPAHWEVVRSRRLFGLRKTKALETDRQLTAAQKYGVIYQDEFTEREGRRVVQVIIGGDILKHVEPNDFIISMRSFQGGIELCRYRGSISSAYVVLIPSLDLVDIEFYAHLFKSKSYIQALQSTSNLVRDGQALRYNNFALVDLPLVPLAEQREIASYINGELRKLELLQEESYRLLEFLQEYRTALISAAVTGQIDVRGA